MIIEFCGVPGGGKSTIAKGYSATRDGVRLVTIDMYARMPEAVYVSLFFIKHPISFFWLFVFVVSHHVPELFWFSLHLMIRGCAKYEKATQKCGIQIIDEGLIHLLLTLSRRALTQEELSTWLSRVVLPDAVCFAATGDFHRFHNNNAPLHPRVRQGAGQLLAWEKAVAGSVHSMREVLVRGNIPYTIISRKAGNDNEDVYRALDTLTYTP